MASADQAFVQQALHDAVERAGAETNRAAGEPLDILEDLIAVRVAVGERHEHVHYINGFALNGSDSAPMVYQHVRDAAYLDVEFERRGVALRRRYWLR